MLELRFHGRGGQGTVNAAQLLAKAVVMSGGYAQFIPAFGVERKGSLPCTAGTSLRWSRR